MKSEKIISVVQMYEIRFAKERIAKTRFETNRKFSSATKKEILAHAHFLCEGIKEYAKNPKKQNKANRHLGALQMLLSSAGWYSLGEVMDHNRP